MTTSGTEPSALFMYVVYRSPLDHPGKWVTRKWKVSRGDVSSDLHCKVADTLDEARTFVPDGYVNIGRRAADDPVIYEVWV